MLAVIAASASIRLGARIDGDVGGERIQAARWIRENVGAITALGVLSLAVATSSVRATRGALGPAAITALAVTATLAAVGYAAGREPPPAAAFANQFGGVLLAGILGWMLGRMRATTDPAPALRRLANVALAMSIAQAAFGGAIAAFSSHPPVVVLVMHAAAGLAAALCIFAVALQCRPFDGGLLALGAASAVLAGILNAVNAPSSLLQLAHSLCGAMLLAAASYARGRFARA